MSKLNAIETGANADINADVNADISAGSSATPAPALHRRKLSFGATARAVAWSFFGVRKARDLEKDAAELNPVHLIVAGVLGAAIFVIALVLLINWVVASGVAK